MINLIKKVVGALTPTKKEYTPIRASNYRKRP